MITPHDVSVAAKNWKNWQNVFEHLGPFENNPLLNQKEFYKFLHEYSVGRTIEGGKRALFLDYLKSPTSPLTRILSDPSGKQLDSELKEIKTTFGAKVKRSKNNLHPVQRTPRSLLSKVASFLEPGSFIAWDTYACKGLNLAMNRPRGVPFRDYATYRKDVAYLMFSSLGTLIRKACAGHYPSRHAMMGDRFHLRVLDVYLMRQGGRGSMILPRCQRCPKF